ncbi:diguanylate cyclase [Halomonas sp. 22501_18_FS]|uniref:diguanylate cyclase n=2 Tax=Oceanospirillales TaxID=135619 RepID=A0A9X4Y9U1_9GAMM|nr:diguanylate cyclase [Halomonas utahensis]MYL73587.1 diguanylate cyclase [Halomonas sp. 22501_18_FS]
MPLSLAWARQCNPHHGRNALHGAHDPVQTPSCALHFHGSQQLARKIPVMAEATPPTAPDPASESTETRSDIVHLVRILSLAAALALFFFSWRNAYLTADPRWFGTVMATLGGVLIANLLLHLLTQNLAQLRWGFIVIITAVLVFVALSGVEQGSGVMWLHVYPPVVFYISSPRFGIISCVAGWLTLVVALTPLGQLLFSVAEYPLPFRIVLATSLAFVMVFSYLLDRARRQHAERLRQMAEIFEHAATHDALTNLANRREGTDRLAREFARFQRNDTPFSVILADIDHFKTINDTLGHGVGDQVIQTIATRLTSGCRKMDSVIRWGGEEFLVVLPGTAESEAITTAQRIRQQIVEQPVTADGRPLEVTCSFGVAEIRPSDAIQTLLQRADERLYHAKTTGRNRIISRRFGYGSGGR